MKTQTITSKDIDQWLRTLNPFEQFLKDYYLKHHTFMPIQQVPKAFLSLPSLSPENPEDFLMLQEGDFLFIPVQQDHAAYIDSDSVMVNIGIRASTFFRAFRHSLPDHSVLGDFFMNVLQNKNAKTGVILFHTGNDKQIQDLFSRLAVSYCTSSPYARLKINLQMSEIFLCLLENYNGTLLFSSDTPDQFRLLPSIMQYIALNYRDASARSVAEHFNYSLNHLNLILKKSTGYTAGELILTSKMRQAASMLKDTSYSIASIGEYLNYKDTANLIRSFKKYYSITPAQYRKKHSAFPGMV